MERKRIPIHVYCTCWEFSLQKVSSCNVLQSFANETWRSEQAEASFLLSHHRKGVRFELVHLQHTGNSLNKKDEQLHGRGDTFLFKNRCCCWIKLILCWCFILIWSASWKKTRTTLTPRIFSTQQHCIDCDGFWAQDSLAKQGLSDWAGDRREQSNFVYTELLKVGYENIWCTSMCKSQPLQVSIPDLKEGLHD